MNIRFCNLRDNQSLFYDGYAHAYAYWGHTSGNEYRCSRCGYVVHMDETNKEPQYQHCPYCGIRIKESGM